MEVTGKIKLIGKTETFGTDFTKRQLVVTTTDQYPQHISIDFIKDKCSILDKYKVGQDVKVSINLGGREWINPQGETKYFNSVTGWRIESVENAPNVPLPPKSEDAKLVEQVQDDLPF
jgi:hypothetical protein